MHNHEWKDEECEGQWDKQIDHPCKDGDRVYHMGQFLGTVLLKFYLISNGGYQLKSWQFVMWCECVCVFCGSEYMHMHGGISWHHLPSLWSRKSSLTLLYFLKQDLPLKLNSLFTVSLCLSKSPMLGLQISATLPGYFKNIF